MSNLDYGWPGHSHGWRGASTDAFWCNWHCLPIGFTAVSNSRSMLGHQTWARALILEMPWWASCSSSISWVCCFDGTITCVFHNTHLPSVVNSFFWLQYGCNLLSWQWCGHALSVNWYRITSCPLLNAKLCFVNGFWRLRQWKTT